MDTNSRAFSSDLRTFSKRLIDCTDAKDLRQRRSSRLRRSCATSIATIANMLILDANNNSRSERARRNWKRSYYCCFWIGVSSVSASSLSSVMEANNNNNNNNYHRRAELPDVVQAVNRNGHHQPAPVNQQNRLVGHNIQEGDLNDPVIYENDDCIRFGRQLRQIGDEIEETNVLRGHQHPFRDALVNFLRVVFGAVFGINFYGHA